MAEKKEKKFKRGYAAEEKRHDKVVKKETSRHEKKHLKEIEIAEDIGKAECKAKSKKRKRK